MKTSKEQNLKMVKTRRKVLEALEAEEKHPKIPQQGRKKLPWRNLLLIGGALILLFVILFGSAIYYAGWRHPVTGLVSTVIPYPAALVNNHVITYRQWYTQYKTLSAVYDKTSAENPEVEMPEKKEIELHVLERMIEEALIRDLAEKYKIVVTNEELDQELQSVAAEIGGAETLEGQLKDFYGMNISQFKQQLLKPLLVRRKLEAAIKTDDRLNFSARQKAENILSEIKNGSATFEEQAKRYSEDVSAFQEGDLGYFSRGEMVAEFEEVAFTLQIGDVSEIVKTRFGYHIVKVDEQLKDEYGVITQVKARHILIRGLDLSDYLAEERKSAFVKKFIAQGTPATLNSALLTNTE